MTRDPRPYVVSPRARRTRWKLFLWLLIACICTLGVAVSITALDIARHVGDEARPAEAIVVFGAAEYAGRPSPVFKARLDHAYDLYQRGIAPAVITTGGFGS